MSDDPRYKCPTSGSEKCRRKSHIPLTLPDWAKQHEDQRIAALKAEAEKKHEDDADGDDQA